MNKAMEKEYVMEEMRQQIVELKKEKKNLQCSLDQLNKEKEHYKRRFNDLKSDKEKYDAAYVELCNKCNMYQNTIDSLVIRLADVLRGK